MAVTAKCKYISLDMANDEELNDSINDFITSLPIDNICENLIDIKTDVIESIAFLLVTVIYDDGR